MVEGFLLVDKPRGVTSHDVVARIRSLSGIRKVGHAGTLDPMATGLLVLGLGRTTRLLRFVQGLPKEYHAVAVLGIATDTLDADGSVLSRTPMPVSEAQVAGVLGRFTGEISQIPPMVSALKVDGKRLHRLAREGVEVERAPRRVEVHELELTGFEPGEYPEVAIRVVCSSGTYVRVLAEDIAAALGGHAHLRFLRRVRAGSLLVDNAIALDEVTAGSVAPSLLAPAEALADLAAVDIGEDEAERMSHGVAVESAQPSGPAPVRVMSGGRLIAICVADGRRLVPEVVVT